jgi:3-oxoacyl-[acyl-carrier protein] reductase
VTEGGSKGGKAIAIQGDVSKPEEIHRLFSEIKKRFGKVDVLVNNAGTYELLRWNRLHRSTSKNISI